jgi:hypothetical protein
MRFMSNGYPERWIAVIDYDSTFATESRQQVFARIDQLVAELKERTGRAKVDILGHSLGTLGIRQLLCAAVMQPPQMLEALHSVTLFGTPLNGSTLALFGGALIGGEIAEALKPGNAQLRMLRVWSESVHPLLQWCKVRLVLGTDDQVVGNEYADLIDFAGDAKPAALLNFDHGDLVKPRQWAESAIRDELVGALR